MVTFFVASERSRRWALAVARVDGIYAGSVAAVELDPVGFLTLLGFTVEDQIAIAEFAALFAAAAAARAVAMEVRWRQQRWSASMCSGSTDVQGLYLAAGGLRDGGGGVPDPG